ncbi:Alpha/beta hydrolase fold-1 [Mycena maculata]|uniref:Alpha/beta hydrolase fold-1 n=1 Tax=Mycena maculata TaxID=230809 RepID=A0AAD7IVR6_9AGAR|nr:Alpha/beta hydrolase fold-1 [Mycena maculata]
MSVKRYYTPESARNSKGLTLLFAHCIGAHKEQWEPTIQRIFERHHSQVHEAWAVDWQTHGDSAVLNRELLETSPSRMYGVSAFEWAEAVAAFMRSPHLKGKRIVPIGHSAGAGTMVLTTRDFPSSALEQYTSLILIEPTIIPRDLFYLEIDERVSTMEFVVAATLVRREKWPSREAAHAWLSRRVPWDSWDPRVLRMLSQYGLEDTPDGGVAIKGDRRQEALSYADAEPHFVAAQELRNISTKVPVHFIWGKDSPLVPEFVQEALAEGVAASVTRVQGGHMIVQEQPDNIADAICGVLDTIGGKDNARVQHASKL